jgi:hypothetical protein
MSPENRPTLYNYQPLERLLIEFYDPKELGNQLDEIMSELVEYAGHEMSYNQNLVQRHYLLRLLRNIFWDLKKNG